MRKSLERSIISLVFRRQTCSHAGVRYGYCRARVRRFMKPASICPQPSATPSPACKTFTAVNHPSISSRGPQHRAITFQLLRKVHFSQILSICCLLRLSSCHSSCTLQHSTHALPHHASSPPVRIVCDNASTCSNNSRSSSSGAYFAAAGAMDASFILYCYSPLSLSLSLSLSRSDLRMHVLSLLLNPSSPII